MNTTPSKEVRLQLLRAISGTDQPITRRELAGRAGISLRKANYWITKMAKEGWIRIERSQPTGKSICAYSLTPKGREEKFPLLFDSWNRKLREYNILRNEVDALHQEILQYSDRQAPKANKAIQASAQRVNV